MRPEPVVSCWLSVFGFGKPKTENGRPGLLKDESGVAYIEFALSVFLLSLMLLGMAEVSSFIRVKNKMNQVADQMGNILSTIPVWRPDEQVEPYIGAAELIAEPFGVHLSVSYCSGYSGTNAQYQGTYGDADCSLGLDVAATAPLTDSDCSMAQSGNGMSIYDSKPASQYVVISASCRYKPYLNYFKLFDAMVVTSTTIAPMRYSMQW